MAKIIAGTTMSLDGFINDRNGSVASLYPDLAALGETEMLQESIKNTGAVIMGRHSYDMADGDFTGYEYQVPIFVLTHHIPEQMTKGQNENLKIKFITNGIESAVEKAKQAAGDKDVQIVGGADTIQQLLKARLVDEIQIGIMPVLLGKGLRFFERLENEEIELEKMGVVESPGRTDLHFRVIKQE
jgi:dihydrofolate reductase